MITAWTRVLAWLLHGCDLRQKGWNSVWLWELWPLEKGEWLRRLQSWEQHSSWTTGLLMQQEIEKLLRFCGTKIGIYLGEGNRNPTLIYFLILHKPIIYTTDKWKALAYDSFICEFISSIHTDGVCRDWDRGRPAGEQGSSESPVTVSPMGENVYLLMFITFKSKPNHKAFTVLFSGLTVNIILLPFSFLLRYIALYNCCHSNRIVFA